MKINTKSPVYVIAFTAAVSAALTAGIITLQTVSAPAVRRNAEAARAKALARILYAVPAGVASTPHALDAMGLRRSVDDMTDTELATLYDQRVRRQVVRLNGRDVDILVAYDRDIPRGGVPGEARAVAYASAISGVGFWARIDGFLAVTPDAETIKGIVFLEHQETPGLGGRIAEEQWRRQWRGVKAVPDAAGRYVYVGGEPPSGPADARFGRYVPAITGATGTSVAVEKFVNEDLATFRLALQQAGMLAPGREAAK